MSIAFRLLIAASNITVLFNARPLGSDPADAKQARKRAQDYEIQVWTIFDTINEELGTAIRKAFESLDPYQVSELPQFPSAINPPAS
jgi:hypothetical protein